jgi:hypothetical protein
LLYVFRFRRQEGRAQIIEAGYNQDTDRPATDLLAEAGQEPVVDTAGQLDGSTYKQIFHLKAMPLLIAFALIYIGVEVTLGGTRNVS